MGASNPVHVAAGAIGISFRQREKFADFVQTESQIARATNELEPLSIACVVSPI